MKKLLELKDITAGYDENIVLRNVTLVVYENDFLGIIGPNGGGKSTLLKIILGLVKPIHGTIEFFGEAFSKRSGIGYLPQINTFDRKFPITVFDVVLSGLMAKVGVFKSFSKEDRKNAEKLLDRMGILHLKACSIGELSGGQMQRVFLCRALVSSPKLLLLDEPNTYVDRNFETSFYETLKELNQEKTIILVSHDIGVVSSYVKNIACIDGSLFYHSAAEEITHTSREVIQELLQHYRCPVDLIAHGNIPHRVLRDHGEE